MYPWPIGEVDNAMDVALDIAMIYLDRTGQAVKFQKVQWTAAMAIATARKGGIATRLGWPTSPSRLLNTENGVGSSKSVALDEYRDIEYTVVQGVERGVSKSTASVAGVVIMGQAGIKSKAVAAAEKAIDRARASKKMRSAPPEDNE
jgi:hypothetical protein